MDKLRFNIKHLRIINNLTQAEMGAICGVSRDQIMSYERGTVPSVHTMHKIVNHFHIAFNDLMEKDLSTYRSAEVNTFMVQESEEKYQKKEETPFLSEKHSILFTNQERTIQALHRAIEAQEQTIKSQKETIEALKEIIAVKSRHRVHKDDPSAF
ncbi:helix-turn-helix transcriptional regulator [Rhodonellum sp.]|uniref:helix-turn-helix transcriptional regulator n=1 Tax=Rhodonellum sp. TaxID=2231180 RepID=UPI002723EAEE|nr:helix-turn-helix transcriptional regulator [Rhodonellum sp.]MDO9554566.1 helix-turn-helix transcriptional regulator [Rhodonellum sp.]